jgi:hypothetical protein
MSIGIAIALNDMVLLVASGRRPSGNLAPTERPEKITAFGDALAVVEYGDDTGARTAAVQLGQTVTASITGRSVTDTIVDTVQRIGAAGAPGTLVGLIAGGIDAEGAYVSGAVFGPGMEAPKTDLARPVPGEMQFVVLGGESIGAKAFFANLASRAMNASGDDANGLLVMLQRAAKKTIRHAANRDLAASGRVEWRLLVKGKPATSGYL